MSTYDDQSGESFSDAVQVDAETTEEGIRWEYEWLEHRFGTRGADWEMMMQSLTFDSEHPYDVLHIRLADGTEKRIHFDISNFFGKF